MSQALQRTWPEVRALPGLRGQRTALEKKENYKESRKRRLFFGRGDLTEDEGGGGRWAVGLRTVSEPRRLAASRGDPGEGGGQEAEPGLSLLWKLMQLSGTQREGVIL